MSLVVRTQLMQVVAIGFMAFSLIWSLAPYTSINFPARFLIDLIDWPLDNFSAEFSREVKWLSSIGAGLLAAFSIFLFAVVAPAIKANNTKIINTSKLAIVTWYVIDSAGSIASGVASNAVFNTLFFIMVIAPLVRIKEA